MIGAPLSVAPLTRVVASGSEHMYVRETSDSCDVDAEFGEIAGQLNLLNARLVAVAERLIQSGEWDQHGMRSA